METKTCQNCKIDFAIASEDFEFYAKIKVSPPTFCFDCRLQRRMMFRNERTLYKRPNNAIVGEDIVSIHRPDTKYTVYDDKTWWSDSWNPISYGSEYDFSRPFFQQFKELYERIPLINLSVTNMVNCTYCNVSEGDKGSFMLSASNANEDCLYGNRLSLNKECMDTYIANASEFSYELVTSSKNNRVFYSQGAVECVDSYFLYDCKNCSDCIGCVNLRNANHCIFNKQYSKEEYLKIKGDLHLESYPHLQEVKSKFEQFVSQSIHRSSYQVNAVKSTGDNLEEVKNVNYGFDFINAEDCKNVVWGGYSMKDGMDAGPGVGIEAERLYEAFDTALQVRDAYFTAVVYHSYDVQYSINCHNCSHIFGCHGLRKKEYCILNRQYTKEEYEALVPKIIAHMSDMPYIDEKGRTFGYGEFFPYDISPFAYNETIAQEYFPLSKEEVSNKGFAWYERPHREYEVTLQENNIPDTILGVTDDILNQILECKSLGDERRNCTTAFRIMPKELEFYRRQNIPLPHYCPNCRHSMRLAKRNPLKLWHRSCMCNLPNHDHAGICPNEFETSYAPERTEKVYCESCYVKEVL